jgi:Ni2+-binding GTPase involved in maturation of urease and hydrogenase
MLQHVIDLSRALASDVHTLKPDIKVIPTSCKTGEGIDEIAEALVAI